MKKILFIITTGLVSASCSPVKYSYYFDRYLTKNPVSANSDTALKNSTMRAGADMDHSVATMPEKTLVSNASKETMALEKRKIQTVDRNEMINLSKKTREDMKALTKTSKDFNAVVRGFQETAGEPDKSKNGFAAAGFSAALAGLLLGLLGSSFFLPLLIPGIIFSAIGMKSERRRLAMAGLIISIGALVISFIILLILISSVDWGAYG